MPKDVKCKPMDVAPLLQARKFPSSFPKNCRACVNIKV